MKALGFLLTIILSFFPSLVYSQRQASTDFDADGLSDFVLINSNRNVLNWNALKSDGSALPTLGEFGRLGFHVVMGDWLGAGIPQPATVTDTKGEIVWRIFSQGISTAHAFGVAGETAVAGADFNQDGVTDAAVVSNQENQLKWRIHTQLFLNNDTEVKEYLFGRKGETFFFYDPEGKGDRIATFSDKGKKGFIIRFLNPITGGSSRVVSTQIIPTAQKKKAPLPLKLSSGKDGLVFSQIRGNKSILSLYRSGNKKIQRISLNATGDILVGNFSSEPGEEVAIQSSQGFIIYNPESKTLTQVSASAGIAVDEVNINRVGNPINQPQEPPSTPPSNDPPLAGLSEVCQKYSAIANGEMLIKSEISQHIPGQDPRATGYTLVCASVCPRNQARADFFYADGSYAGSVAKYGTFAGNGKPRLYGAVGEAPQHFADQISQKAQTIGNGKLYMQISSVRSGDGSECKEFNPTGRNGGLY